MASVPDMCAEKLGRPGVAAGGMRSGPGSHAQHGGGHSPTYRFGHGFRTALMLLLCRTGRTQSHIVVALQLDRLGAPAAEEICALRERDRVEGRAPKALWRRLEPGELCESIRCFFRRRLPIELVHSVLRLLDYAWNTEARSMQPV